MIKLFPLNIYRSIDATLFPNCHLTKWKPKQITNLLEICTEETHFMDYQGNIWTQTDGTAIGKSISGDITGIYMEFYENEYTLNPQKNAFISTAIWS